ncbi:MAG: hypothetical protein WDO73_08750 [Ignavibacteriota bacterium]
MTVNGKSVAQPIYVKMDPRVKVTPEVQQIFTLTTQIEDNARTAETAYKDARTLLEKVKARPQSAASDGLVKQLTEIAPERVAPTGGGRGGRGGGGGGAFAIGGAEAATPPNLSTIAGQMVAAVQAMQAAEMAPTAAQLAAVSQEQAAYSEVMAKWAALRGQGGRTGRPLLSRSARREAGGEVVLRCEHEQDRPAMGWPRRGSRATGHPCGGCHQAPFGAENRHRKE